MLAFVFCEGLIVAHLLQDLIGLELQDGVFQPGSEGEVSMVVDHKFEFLID